MVIGDVGPRGHLAIHLVGLVQCKEQDYVTLLTQHLMDYRVLVSQTNRNHALAVFV